MGRQDQRGVNPGTKPDDFQMLLFKEEERDSHRLGCRRKRVLDAGICVWNAHFLGVENYRLKEPFLSFFSILSAPPPIHQ